MINAVIRRTFGGRALGALVGLGALLLITSCCFASDPEILRRRAEDFVGTFSCTAVSCHGGGGPRYWSGGAKGGEYVRWLGNAGTYTQGRRAYDPHATLIKSDGDPHAMAAQRMTEPRFQEVLRRASGRADGVVDEAMIERCAKCHDPAGEARDAERGTRSAEAIPSPSDKTAFEPTLSPGLRQLSLGDLSSHPIASASGIGCETCHGGARRWLTAHYQSGVSREELFNLGMIDTKSLLVRAKLCAGCHVGFADQDMNHDMIAAGHPPLRFEQASYEALLGSKHWDDAPARTANPEYEVRLWAAGRIAAADAALALLEGRAQGSGFRVQGSEAAKAIANAGVAKPWPEFAESNCLACHQPLRKGETGPGTLKELGKHGAAGAWQTWNTAFVEAAFRSKTITLGELPPPDRPWSATIGQLRLSLAQTTFADRQQAATLASQARIAIDREADLDFDDITASSVLNNIGEVGQNATWDEQCQYLAALAAARRALNDQRKISAIRADELERRIERVAAALRFVAPGREWPVVYSEHPTIPAADVLRELGAIRQDLLAEAGP